MAPSQRFWKKFLYAVYLWIFPVVDLKKLIKWGPAMVRYCRDWFKYKKLSGAEKLDLINSHPRLYERLPTTPIDNHYFYQDIWAFKKIYQSKVPGHVDIGSTVEFVGFLSAITKVTFIDIRPIAVNLSNFNSKAGNILNLPFTDNSLKSLSCLHVAEHIGLGRYGDDLDPQGTRKACAELFRVLALGGKLYFSLPVGRPRVCFNAHRIHSPQQILDYFKGLKLVEFAGINDQGVFQERLNPQDLTNSQYACGLFLFTKEEYEKGFPN
ncbi:MAG: DUF268 domain-containing protein [Patescibacteria group bacterium]